MERSRAFTKEKSPDGLSVPIQNTIIINRICYYFRKTLKKYNEIIDHTANL